MKKKKRKASAHLIDSLIGPGSEFEGVLQSEDNLRIDGRFNGSIESQGSVTIGERIVPVQYFRQGGHCSREGIRGRHCRGQADHNPKRTDVRRCLRRFPDYHGRRIT